MTPAASPRPDRRAPSRSSSSWPPPSSGGRSSDQVTVTAHLSSAVGLYPGSDVRILGVKVGKVLSVTPDGTSDTVRLEYDGKYRVPADAEAAVVSPSLVSDRYLQLLPAYTGGAGDAQRGRHPAGADRRAGRAGPGHRQPRPADQGARPERRQLRRRAVRPARHRVEEPRRQRPADQRHDRQPLAGHRRRWPAARTTSSPRSRTCSRSPARWPPTTRRCGRSTPSWPASPTSCRGSATTSARPCRTSRSRSTEISSFVARQPVGADHRRARSWPT